MSLPSPIRRRYQLLYEIGTGNTMTRKGLMDLLEITGQALTRTLAAITEAYGVQFIYVANAADGIGQSESAQGKIRIVDWGILDEAKFLTWYRLLIDAEEDG